MKYCPTCQTEYDEEILRFCTKDGTPLVDDSQPNFTELPSITAEENAADDFGEETVIRKDKPKAVIPPPTPDFVEDTAVEAVEAEDTESPRIVISTQKERVVEQPVRAKTTAYKTVAPPKSNTALTVVTTILLTLVVLGGVGGLFWALSGKDNGTNVNINTNPPENLNLNVGSNTNASPTPFDFNTNTNSNISTNLGTNLSTNLGTNTNQKTPSPTKTPGTSPTPTPSAEPSESPEPTIRPSATPVATRPPVATPTRQTPPSGAPAGTPDM
jgi:hypothetical protein